MMKNAHIAFVSFPHRPHVNPSLPIVSTLVRRGYRVTYATADQYASRIEATGAELVACPAFQSGASRAHGGGEADRIAAVASTMCRLAIGTLKRLTSVYEKSKPNLIIYDFVAFAGRILANQWDIPAVQVSSHFAFNKGSLSLQMRDPGYREVNIGLSKQADGFFEHYGIASDHFIFHREKLNIHLFPRDFDPSDVEDERCLYAGRCPGEQPHFGLWRKGDHHWTRPIALVATSTTYARGSDYFRMCIEALRGLRWHVILFMSDDAETESFLPLPADFEIVRNTSPTNILPHASLLIFGGGTITAAEAAYHGVPMVMTSCGAPELEGLADNFARLGIGIHLKQAELNVESLRKAALEVSENPVILNRVREFQDTVRREPGAEETANRIEQYLEAQAG